MTRFLLLILVGFGLGWPTLSAQSSSPLGLPATIEDLYIPGSMVEVIPRKDNESSLVLRILEIKPAADGHRYTLEAYALDPGVHRVSDFLRYTDTLNPVENLETTFEGTLTHPPESLPKPAELSPSPPEKMGGYRNLVIVIASIWTVVLLVILFYRKKQRSEATAPDSEPTLHEKLQVLVCQASRGTLEDDERARLERLILGHWKGKLPQLSGLPPAQALIELRQHTEASPLVLKLEEWLHSPKPGVSESDLTPLLQPYLDSPQTG